MTEKKKNPKNTFGSNSKIFWHRQGGEPLKETARQYAMFQFFLSLPPEIRTAEKVQKHFNLQSDRQVHRLRSEKMWNQRAQAHDEAQAVRIDEKRAKVLENAAFDWAKWETDNLENVREITDLLFKKTKEILTLPVVETTRKNPIIDQNGELIYQEITLKPTKFSAGDAPRYAEAAVLLSKFYVEQTEAAKAKEAGGFNLHLPKPKKPVDQMSPEEIEEWIAECNSAKTALEKGESVEDYTGGATQ